MGQNDMTRIRTLIRLGVPRYVRVYKPDGNPYNIGPVPEYVVIFTGRYRKFTSDPHFGLDIYKDGQTQGWESNMLIDVNEWGYSRPTGIKDGILGLRIEFRDMPYRFQKMAIKYYIKLWGLEFGPAVRYFITEYREWSIKQVAQTLRTLR